MKSNGSFGKDILPQTEDEPRVKKPKPVQPVLKSQKHQLNERTIRKIYKSELRLRSRGDHLNGLDKF